MLVPSQTPGQRGVVRVFRDRIEAGDRLAELVGDLAGTDPIVLAIPRGGVVVAERVARALGAELDVVVPRKLGAPGNPELGIGAVAPGVRVLNEDLISRLGVRQAEIEAESERQLAEVERRTREYRGDRREPRVSGRTALIVDDGVATGGTVLAAAAWARARGAERVVLAVPVVPRSMLQALHRSFDDVIAVDAPRGFGSVGEWYRDFRQVSDAEVVAVLAGA